MATDDITLARTLPVWLSCGCVVGFKCKPSVGDTILCIFHDSPVRVIRKPATMPIEVA